MTLSSRRLSIAAAIACGLAAAATLPATGAVLSGHAGSPPRAIAAAGTPSSSGNVAAPGATASTATATATPTPAPAATPRPPSIEAVSTPTVGPSATQPTLPAVGRVPGPVPWGPASPFVTASGSHLMLGGHVWEFTGYDDYRLPSASPGFQCGGPMSDSDVMNALTEMRRHSGATVVRTWFTQSYGGPGNWSQFDRVLADAAAVGVKVIPVLVDEWGSCEPWPNGVQPYRNLAWYQGGYRQTNDGYPLSYRDFAAAMAKHYAGDSTIAFWQLVNEAEASDSMGGPCEEAAANQAIRSFADDVTGVIKANDPNHLVSLGTIGSGQCGGQGVADYTNLHSGRVDLCEIHDYAPGALPGDQWNGVASRIDACLAMGKPIFAGEVGIDASVDSTWTATGTVTATTLAQRATLFQEKMQAQFGLGLSGFLVWEKSPGASTGLEVGPGDPLEVVMTNVASSLP